LARGLATVLNELAARSGVGIEIDETALRSHEYSRQATAIGRVTGAHPGRVVLRTALGAPRVVGTLTPALPCSTGTRRQSSAPAQGRTQGPGPLLFARAIGPASP
jgi:hypothetical protein